MEQLFLFLNRLTSRYKLPFFTIVILLFLGALFLTTRLGFHEDIDKIMPVDKDMARINKLMQESGFRERLVLTIHHPDSITETNPDQLIKYADRLVDSLEQPLAPYVEKITYRVSENQMNQLYDDVYRHLPVFLDNADYRQLDSLVTEQGVEEAVSNSYKALVSPSGFAMKEKILKDPLNITPMALEDLQSLKYSDDYAVEQGRLFSESKRHLLLFVTPSHGSGETGKNQEFLSQLDAVIAALTAEHQGKVRGEYFGTSAIAVSNAERLKTDIMVTVSSALLLLLIILSIFFRRKSVFFIIFLPAVVGGAVSLALLYLIKGSVSAVSLGVGSVLLGITVDYALHFFAHYRNTGDVRTVLRDIATPVMMSCVTTASAFLCLLSVKAPAIQDLGMFAAFAIFVAALFTLLVLPRLIGSSEGKAASQDQEKATIIDRLLAYPLDKNKWVIIAVLLLTGVFLFTAPNVRFESDMDKMNYMPDRLKQAQERLDSINNYKLKNVYLVAEGQNKDEALRTNERALRQVKALKEDEVIDDYSSVSVLLSSDSLQRARIQRWRKFWTEQKLQQVDDWLQEATEQTNFKAGTFQPFVNHLDTSFAPLPDTLFNRLQKEFLSQYFINTKKGKGISTVVRVKEENREQVYSRLSGVDNLVVFDKRYMTNQFIELLKEDFDQLVLISMVVVFGILLLMFGRLELALIAFIPMAVSWLWTVGIMGITGVKFNIFNIIISTFVFGLGIDYSIFITRGLMQQYKYGRDNLLSYKTSIFFSVLTTIAGMGVLIFARHPALESIATMSVIGILSVVLITFTLLPLLFRRLITNRTQRGTFPITWWTIVRTFTVYLFLILFIILLSIFGVLLFIVLPFWQTRRRIIFQRVFQLACKAYLWTTFQNRVYQKNPNNIDLSQPAIFISNHQSLIDTPLVLMQHPKLNILTNNWVIYSPIFGPIAHLAGFFNVSKGLEHVRDQLREKMKAGYSLVVFPEGTRSRTGKMGRFHKGAFYLAEELGLPIQPMLLHGNGDFLRKGEFYGRENSIHVKLLERIAIGDDTFGTTYREKAKQFRRYMSSEYLQMREEYEKPPYWSFNVIRNYLFKGPVLEWYVRVKLRLENYFQQLYELLPKEGRIVDLGCGYGYMDYMLKYGPNDRHIVGIDYDCEKVEVANHCYAKDEAIEFVCADVLNYDLPSSDAFVLYDLLHYMPYHQQKTLLQSCIEKLNERGLIVIRDGDRNLKDHHKSTRFTEFLSTRFGFNQTQDNQKQLYFLAHEDIENIISSYGVTIERFNENKRTSNVMWLIRKEG